MRSYNNGQRMVYRLCFLIGCLAYVALAVAQTPPPNMWFLNGNPPGTDCDINSVRYLAGIESCSRFYSCKGYTEESSTYMTDPGGNITGLLCDPTCCGATQWNAILCTDPNHVWNDEALTCTAPCPTNGTSAGPPSNGQLSSLCQGGCEVTEQRNMNAGPYQYEFSYTYTGEFCSASDPNMTPPNVDCGSGELGTFGCEWSSDDDPNVCDFNSQWTVIGSTYSCQCDQNATWNSDDLECVGPSTPQCDPGWTYSPVWEICIKDEDDNCPQDGYVKDANGVCQPPDDPEPECPAGTHPEGPDCVDDPPEEEPPPEPECPPGQTLTAEGACKDDQTDEETDDIPTCGEGFTLVGAQCISNDPGNLPNPGENPFNCPPGTSKINGVCVSGVLPQPPLPQPTPDPGDGTGGCLPGYIFNPDPPLCLPLETYAPSGDCDIPATCQSPEPTDCAIVQALHDIQCQSVGDPSELQDEITSAFGDNPQGWDTYTNDINLGLLDSTGYSGACPVPLTVNVLGSNVDISFQPLCDLALLIQPLILIGAFLLGGRIVIGGF